MAPTTTLRPSRLAASTWEAAGGAPLLDRLARHPAVLVPGALAPGEAARLSLAVLAAREQWTPDFGGEQFTLGRAFYTHLETGRSKEYFAGAAQSDALVEERLPGVPALTLALLARLVGGEVR